MAKKHSKYCFHRLERILRRNGEPTKNFYCIKCRKLFRELK